MNRQKEMSRLCPAIKLLLNDWIEGAEFDIISAYHGLFCCNVKKGANLELLKEFGIELRDRRLWARDRESYSFTINSEIVRKIADYSTNH
jgi:hypothetical protein